MMRKLKMTKVARLQRSLVRMRKKYRDEERAHWATEAKLRDQGELLRQIKFWQARAKKYAGILNEEGRLPAGDVPYHPFIQPNPLDGTRIWRNS